MTFDGFSPAARHFLADLRANNERDWFNARKALYEVLLLEPALAFIEALGERLKLIAPELRYDLRTNGSGSLMRIYRDVRFSADKSPYKTNIGIVFWQGTGKKTESPSFYFHMDADETWIGGGLYQFPKPLLTAYQQAVLDDVRGPELVAVLSTVQQAGYAISGEQTKRVPRGFDPDHPRAELLRYRGLYAGTAPFSDDIVASPALVDACFDHCVQIAPLQQWLARL